MPSPAALSGELGLLSLFDLGQLLMLNGATGALAVTRDGRRGFLYFDGGRIVNALDDEHRDGEGAALRMFAWRTGQFEFRPEAPGASRAIEVSTEALMLEAARRLDESGAGGGVTEKLVERAGAFEALREAFQTVARAGAGAGLPELGAAGSPFALLQESSDVLLVRPGRVPRLRRAGQWRDAAAAPTEPASYERLRGRLPEGDETGGGDVRSFPIAHADGHEFAITRVRGEHEALWVRAAGLTPTALAQLDGPLRVLRSLLESRSGLVLVAGADADAADRLLHACVAELLARRGATVLLVAGARRWRHDEGAGALALAAAADAPAMLREIAPAVAAFDVAHATVCGEALAAAPLVLVAVVSPDEDGAFARWRARMGPGAGEAFDNLLAATPVGVVFTPGTCAPGQPLPFTAARLATAAELPGPHREAA